MSDAAARSRLLRRDEIANVPPGSAAEKFAAHGQDVARSMLAAGLIPTADHRGWTDALTWCTDMLSTLSNENPVARIFLGQVAYQMAGAAVLLDDLAPDKS